MAIKKSLISLTVLLCYFLGQVSCTNNRIFPRTSKARRGPRARGTLHDVIRQIGDDDRWRKNDLYRVSGTFNDRGERVEVNPVVYERRRQALESAFRAQGVSAWAARRRTNRAMPPLKTSSLPSSGSVSEKASSTSPISAPSASSTQTVHSRNESSLAGDVDEQRRKIIQRDMEMRKHIFQRTILKGLGMKKPPTPSVDPETRRMVVGKLRQLMQPVPSSTGERHCYVVQCSPPGRMNASLWRDQAQPNLRLNFALPRLDRKKDQQVHGAKLKLFFKARDGVDKYGSQIPGYVVSVHQFTRRMVVRKGRVVNRTSVIDRISVPLSGNVRLSMNVKSAVQTWMQRPRRNLGLEIRVTWLNGTAVDARSVLAMPVCQSGPTEQSCSHIGGNRMELPDWPETSFERRLLESQGRPLLDVKIVDRTTSPLLRRLAEHSGPHPLNLGTIDDLIGKTNS